MNDIVILRIRCYAFVCNCIYVCIVKSSLSFIFQLLCGLARFCGFNSRFGELIIVSSRLVDNMLRLVLFEHIVTRFSVNGVEILDYFCLWYVGYIVNSPFICYICVLYVKNRYDCYLFLIWMTYTYVYKEFAYLIN